MNHKIKFILFGLLLILISCLNATKKNDNIKKEDQLLREEIISEDSITISYLYDTLGNIVSSLKKDKDGKRIGFQKVYYNGTNILKYEVFYTNGKKSKVIAYNKKGVIIEKKRYN